MFKIAHLADVHIRSLVRHNEIRVVTDALVNDLVEHNVNAILVAGDIYHHKTLNITPEVIQEISIFFKKLTNVADVYVILGNHDFNLSNSTRLDIISPIIDLLNQQNLKNKLTLFKNSGVYNITNNIDLSVFSIVDRNNWDKITINNSVINIATYHGPVHGAVTNVGYEIKDEFIKVDFFNQYDFVMLGDIHKTQYLASRETNNGLQPWIAYPGSLLQNTYAEELVNGYLLWEINSRDDFNVSFRKLPNPNPFITLNWMGNIEDTIKNVPQNARCRIKSDIQVSHNDVAELTNILTNEYNAIEVFFKSDITTNTKLLTSNNHQQSILENIRDSKTIMKFISLMNNESILEKIGLNKLEEKIKYYLNLLEDFNEIQRYTNWSIEKLTFNNMFSYGESNSIDLSKIHGMTGIFGPNKIGKSSIPGIIMYALFNSSDRGSIKNIDVCNELYDKCNAKVLFKVNDLSYSVNRSTTKKYAKNGSISANTTLELYELNNGNEIELNDDGRIETDKLVRKLLGSGEDFELTNLSAQGYSDVFLRGKSTERWKFLAKLLDIDIFSKMLKNVNDDIKIIKAKLKDIPDKDWKSLAQSLQEKNKLNSENIILIKNQLELLKDNLSEFERELTILLSQNNVVSIEEIELIQERIKNLNNRKTTIDNDLKQEKLNQEENQLEITNINTIISSVDIESLKEMVDSISIAKERLLEAKHNLSNKEKLFETSKKTSQLLKIVPCDDQFPTCRFISEAHIAKSQLQDQTQHVVMATEALKICQEGLERLVKFNPQEKLDNILRLTKRRDELVMLLNKVQVNIERLNMNSSNVIDNLIKETKKLDELKQKYDALTNNKINDLKIQINNLKSQIKQCENDLHTFAIVEGKLQSEVAKLVEEKNKRRNLLDDLSILDIISFAFSRRGIPKAIISTQLPILNEEIAKILNGIVEFTIEFQNEEESDKLDIYINYNGNRRILELGSGMEKMIGCLAIRVALINVSSLPKANFIIIDEGFGALDEENIESCIRMLRSLTQYFKHVIVISHIDTIKSSVDNIIEVQKDGYDSKVFFE